MQSLEKREERTEIRTNAQLNAVGRAADYLSPAGRALSRGMLDDRLRPSDRELLDALVRALSQRGGLHPILRSCRNFEAEILLYGVQASANLFLFWAANEP